MTDEIERIINGLRARNRSEAVDAIGDAAFWLERDRRPDAADEVLPVLLALKAVIEDKDVDPALKSSAVWAFGKCRVARGASILIEALEQAGGIHDEETAYQTAIALEDTVLRSPELRLNPRLTAVVTSLQGFGSARVSEVTKRISTAR